MDREKFDWINFTVRATDTGLPPLSSVVPVHLYIIDVNDNVSRLGTDFSDERISLKFVAPQSASGHDGPSHHFCS